MNLKLILFQIFLITGARAISTDELYESNDHLSVLPKGDSSYEFVKLNVPVHLYSEKYDVVYVRKSNEKPLNFEKSDKMCSKMAKM